MKPTRRQVLKSSATAAFLPTLPTLLDAADPLGEIPHIATNTYPWLTFARRADREFNLHSDELMGQIAETGIVGYEPIITNPKELEGLGQRMKRHGLEMRSLYVNSVLHDAEKVDQSIADVVQIAGKAKSLGTGIVVTNPSPIRWGGPEDKSDSQLRLQAESLERLGES